MNHTQAYWTLNFFADIRKFYYDKSAPMKNGEQ